MEEKNKREETLVGVIVELSDLYENSTDLSILSRDVRISIDNSGLEPIANQSTTLPEGTKVEQMLVLIGQIRDEVTKTRIELRTISKYVGENI